MAGGTLDLASRSDFPLKTALSGSEVIPGIDTDGTPIAIETSALQNTAASSGLAVSSWGALYALNPTSAGIVANQKAEVFNDPGTHNDPQTKQPVPNNGVYYYVINVGWVYLSPSAATSAINGLANETAARIASDTAIGQRVDGVAAALAQETQARQTAAGNAGNLSDALATESGARARGDAANAQAAADAMSAAEAASAAVTKETAVRSAGEDALKRQIEAVVSGPVAAASNGAAAASSIGCQPSGTLRPGDRPDLFTADVAKSPASSAPLLPAGITPTSRGPAFELQAPGLVGLRNVLWLEPQAVTAFRIVYARAVGPAGRMRVGVQWLGPNYEDAGQSIADEKYLTSGAGVQIAAFRLPPVNNDSMALGPPANAAFARPFLQELAPGGGLLLHSITAEDVTYAGYFSPDVNDLTATIAALSDRITALGG